MRSLISKLGSSLRERGVWATAARVLRHVLYHLNVGGHKARRRKFERDVLNLQTTSERFEAIYRRKLWGNDESVSGPGSTLLYTENLRRELPALFKTHGVKEIFDAPCGDFNWMRHALNDVHVSYVGGDIVQPLVETLQSEFGREGCRFVCIDLTRDAFPKADLMICRDCLFHLSYADIQRVLENFLASDTPLLLTTTHLNFASFENHDIQSGDFRLIDLFSKPFQFSTAALARIDDWVAPDPPRQMCLWSRNQVGTALQEFKKARAGSVAQSDALCPARIDRHSHSWCHAS